MLYLKRYNSEVFLDLKKHLETAWSKALSQLVRSYPPKPNAVQDAKLRNPEATDALTLSDTPEKITTSRASKPLEVAPSFKIPLVYSADERAHLLKKVLEMAKASLIKTADSWREIFKYEEKNQLKSWFKIDESDNELRFQLMVSSGATEAYKTLYTIRVEYGKPGTKTRDFDRIYLISLI
jgi:hypothetical protein